MQQSKAMQTCVPVMIYRSLINDLFRGGFCSRWQRKPYFFGHSGAALIAPPCSWLVSIVQGAPTASRTAKRLAKIRCFRRPREWFSPETKRLLLLLEPSYFVPIATKDCLAHSAALAKSSDKIHFRPAHLRLLLLAFPHFSKEMHEQTNPTRRTTPKKNSSCRMRTLAK